MKRRFTAVRATLALLEFDAGLALSVYLTDHASLAGIAVVVVATVVVMGATLCAPFSAGAIEVKAISAQDELPELALSA